MGTKKNRQPDPPTDPSTDSSEERRTHSPTCPHASKAVDLNKLRKVLKTKAVYAGENCSECTKTANGSSGMDRAETINEFETTMWLCLNCGAHLCRRNDNQHALQHYKTPRSDSHAIAMNTTTYEVYCYECNNEVNPNTVKKLKECHEYIKKELKKTKEIFENIPNNFEHSIRPLLEAVPSSSISNNKQASKSAPVAGTLNRVRGLSNLGNTCFFNAVMQCLAQTPYLLTVLNGVVEGEEFELPGGKIELKDCETIELPAIKGKLSSRSTFTSELAATIEELQQAGGVVNPKSLFTSLTKKYQQFSGGDQHDSHELLRHLLESVRTDDMKRYQRVILNSLGYRPPEVEGDKQDDMRQKCKFYGLQAQNRILVPDQVFQGKLVSTLVCQDCHHTSPRQEHFLDISIPINAELPKPPQRRKISPEPSAMSTQTKTKKDKEREKKLKRTQRNANKKFEANSDSNAATADGSDSLPNSYRSSSSCEHSDADVEDNLIEDIPNDINRAIPPLYDTNGNSELTKSPTSPEKRDECPENSNKDSDDDSGIATSPLKSTIDLDERPVSRCDFVSDLPAAENKSDKPECNNIVVEATISSEGRAKLMRQHSDRLDELPVQEMEALKLTERRTKRNRTFSSMEWSSTIAPRYACEDNECSIQSCLNNFTAIELMCGNNKVGCDSCTELFHGKNGKTVNTDATKQFLISSPPAVLILHLKRFQVMGGVLRYNFRKMSKSVTFPFVLDLAPFCVAKVKNLPNVKKTQKKILYSLYGIVEHSGNMHGGHYTAYVKVRPKLSRDDPRWHFLAQGMKAELTKNDEKSMKLEANERKTKSKEMRSKHNHDNDDSDDSVSSKSSYDDCDGAIGGSDDPDVVPPPPGKWYHVSDTHVQEASEERVLNAQAYLLFYERIY